MAGNLTDSRYSWFRLAASIATGTVACVGMWAVVLVLPDVQDEFGIDRSGASVAYAFLMAGFGLGNWWLGRLVDRFSIFPILIFAALILSASFALASIAPSMWVFLVLQLVIGVAAAAGFAPLIADISHWFSRYRGISVAATAAGNYFAGAIWPLFLKDIIETQGWRTAFIVIAVSCLVLMLPLALALRRRFPHDETPSSSGVGYAVKRISLSPNMLVGLLLVAGFGCCMAMAMPQVHIVAYCVDLGFGSGVGAEMLSAMLAAGIISRLLSGWLADRIGGVYTLLIGSVLQCMALMLYIPFDGLMSLYIVSLVFGLSQGGIVPSYAIIAREYMPWQVAGRRIGILILATIVGMAAGGWASGFIYDMTGSYRAAFLNGIAWNLLNIAIMAYILMRTRSPRPGLQPA